MFHIYLNEPHCFCQSFEKDGNGGKDQWYHTCKLSFLLGIYKPYFQTVVKLYFQISEMLSVSVSVYNLPDIRFKSRVNHVKGHILCLSSCLTQECTHEENN